MNVAAPESRPVKSRPRTTTSVPCASQEVRARPLARSRGRASSTGPKSSTSRMSTAAAISKKPMRRPLAAASSPAAIATSAPARIASPAASAVARPSRSASTTSPTPATSGAASTPAAAKPKACGENVLGTRTPPLLLAALQEREEDDVADGGRVGEEHGDPVDADALARGGRHAVLEGAHEVLVERHRLLVAGRLGLHLRLEAGALVHRVVELAEGVRELHPGHEQLEPVDEARVGVAPPRERARLEREVDHERG